MKKMEYKKNGHLILGVNGWIESGHDASAALIEVTKSSCRIIVALEEEKVTGKKCAYDRFPTQAIKEILEMTSLTPDDIDDIAIGWNYPKLYKLINRQFPFANDKELLNILFSGKKISKKIPITYIEHHLSHAASAYRVSKFSEALVVVIDGCGEEEAFSIWLGEDTKLKCLYKSPINTSFGFLFEATNLSLGFRVNESGKTMGLAAYGKPLYKGQLMESFAENDLSPSKDFEKLCKSVQRLTNINNLSSFENQDLMIRTWLMLFEEKMKLGMISSKPDSFYDYSNDYKNLAASVQSTLEEKITLEIKKWLNKTGLRNVCIAGGVGLNCTNNGKILTLNEVEQMFVQPAAGDAGVSLGSALELAEQLGYKSIISHDFTSYLGVELDDGEIIQYLKDNNIRYKYVEGAEKYIAEKIAKDGIVAVFQGKNEWGPRALGNRSIISSANKGKRDIINAKVKNRELGRPLAPSMLKEDFGFLNNNVKMFNEYMNVAYKAEQYLDEISSILHIDNTYRPQYVTEDKNITYFRQLKEIKKELGKSIIINTSLNNDTPIVYSVKQALKLFGQNSLSLMVFNNHIILDNDLA